MAKNATTHNGVLPAPQPVHANGTTFSPPPASPPSASSPPTDISVPQLPHTDDVHIAHAISEIESSARTSAYAVAQAQLDHVAEVMERTRGCVPICATPARADRPLSRQNG